MGNVVNSGPMESESDSEWLNDMKANQTLDFSRKVSHSQYLKVNRVV